MPRQPILATILILAAALALLAVSCGGTAPPSDSAAAPPCMDSASSSSSSNWHASPKSSSSSFSRYSSAEWGPLPFHRVSRWLGLDELAERQARAEAARLAAALEGDEAAHLAGSTLGAAVALLPSSLPEVLLLRIFDNTVFDYVAMLANAVCISVLMLCVKRALRFVLTLVAQSTATDIDDFMIATFFRLFTKTVLFLAALLVSLRPLSHSHRAIALMDAILRSWCLCLIGYNVTKATLLTIQFSITKWGEISSPLRSDFVDNLLKVVRRPRRSSSSSSSRPRCHRSNPSSEWAVCVCVCVMRAALLTVWCCHRCASCSLPRASSWLSTTSA